MERDIIVILVQRDAKNIPFAKVLYNGKDAFDLDYEERNSAAYFAMKGSYMFKNIDSFVYVDRETGSVLDMPPSDLSADKNHFISGCTSGVENVKSLIEYIQTCANNLDINAYVYVTDGKTEPVFVNESEVTDNLEGLNYMEEFNDFREKSNSIETILGINNDSRKGLTK